MSELKLNLLKNKSISTPYVNLTMEVPNKDETNFNLLEDKQLKPNTLEIKAYKRRWIILTIFIIYAAVNSYQWIEYSIINNIITRYYNVTPVMVDWTSIIYMALYAPLVIPASYVLDKQVRNSILLDKSALRPC